MKKQKPPELSPRFITFYLVFFLIYVLSMIFRNISHKWVVETGFFSPGLLGRVLLLFFLSFFIILNFYCLVRFIRRKYPLLLQILAASEGLFILLMILPPIMLVIPDIVEISPSAIWISAIWIQFFTQISDSLRLVEYPLRILQAIVIVYLLLDRKRYSHA